MENYNYLNKVVGKLKKRKRWKVKKEKKERIKEGCLRNKLMENKEMMSGPEVWITTRGLFKG